MFERIFEQGNNSEIRNVGVTDIYGHIIFYLQCLAKADLVKRNKVLAKLEFIFKQNCFLIIVDTRSEKIRKSYEVVFRELRLLFYQRLCGGKGIEQKVRIDLVLQ